MRMFDIEKFMSLERYDTEVRKARRKSHTIGPKAHEQNVSGKKGTAEYFTPYEIVKRMADKVPEEDWTDPTKTFLEPCFGNGQFLIYMIYNRLQHGVSLEDTFNTLYGVELMEDNVEECKQRIFNMLDAMEMTYDKDALRDVLDAHLVCSDFFEWNFQEWRKMTLEELKTTSKSPKKKNKKNV